MTEMLIQDDNRKQVRNAHRSESMFRVALRRTAVSISIVLSCVLSLNAEAQTTTTGEPPAPDANCTVSAMNRTAPLESDYSFTIYNIPGAAAFIGPGTPTPPPPFRVRVVCSDGTVGETNLAFPEFGSTVVYTGDIYWRRATPIPIGVALSAAQSKLTSGQTTQLRTSGILTTGEEVNLTGRDRGTLYTSSNPALATVSEAGLVTVQAQFSSGSSARVVMTAQNEGVAGSTILQLGGRGSLAGKIYRADGVTPVAGARVTIMGDQPRQSLGTVTTDAGGSYRLDDVGVGTYSVSVVEPATGDIGRGNGALEGDGQTGTVNVRLNGQGTVNVTVLDGSGRPVSNSAVTFTSLTEFRDVRTMSTGSNGQITFERALAGQFTVSTRDTASNMVGAALGLLAAGGTSNVTLKLQPVGSIVGIVYDVDGATPQVGAQVRVVSATRGIVSQTVTGADGSFSFEGLTLSDAPYTIDAMQDGRLRARIPNLIFTSANQRLTQNLTFIPVGKVTGVVTSSNGGAVADATVTVQSQVGQRFAFSAKTDAQGRYAIDGVAVGAFSITANTSTGETANAAGTIASDGDIVTLNLQLAANGIVGTVFERNGTTPVGAGVAVTLQSQTRNTSASTQTNAQGQYGFSVSQPDTYVITASDSNGNKGATTVALTAITPGDPKTVNVVFLGRGMVQGTVRDPSGNPQAGVQVTLTSSSVLGGSYVATSDSQGNYRVNGVFMGDYSVYARNTTTQLAGFGRGRIAEDGSSVTTDVTLAATGTVNGKVVKQDGATVVANAAVEFIVGGSPALKVNADANGNFAFPAVPLGDFTLVATNPVNGDKGQAVSRLVTANETRTLTVRLLGQGAVRVRAVNGSNQPVEGAVVTVTSGSQFGGAYKGMTSADGTVTISPVFNGDVTITAEKGSGLNRISGFGSGTVVNGGTAEVDLTLVSKPVGVLTGVVTKGVNAVPQAGVTVTLTGNNGDSRLLTTGADGVYRFDLVEVGQNYRVTAYINGRVRSRFDVTLATADETVTRNLVLLGAGTVSGVVADAQSRPQSGIRVTLTNSDPTYGGTWEVTTQSDGSYRLTDVPAGNFVLRARSNDARLAAQDSGTVRFDADAVVINMTLVDNAVSMPVNLYDANGAWFDVQGNGSIATGVNGVFTGNRAADVAAGRLEIVVNNVAVPFSNGDGTIGRMTQAGQLIEVDELNQASGLNVTRRIYVPKNGYFSRNLEILENRTANPVTVGVRIVSNFAQGSVGARVVDTSSGDSVLDISAEENRDRWLIVDDEKDADPFEPPFASTSENPAVAMVFDGVNGERKIGAAAVTAVGTAAKVSWQWTNVTVQPGESIALMHFTSQQLGRAPARAAAERLSQLPPEAIEGLTPEERAMIKNFKLPADGLSSVTPLPAIDGSSVSGQVLAGDGATPIAKATVKLKSTNPLFGRTYSVQTDSNGRYGFTSRNAGRSDVVAIPQDGFTVTATHPSTRAVTAPASGSFAAGAVAAQKDLVFNGTGILKGTVRRHTGAVVTSGTVAIPYLFPGKNIPESLFADIDSSGAFQYIAIAPGSYLVSASQLHPQGNPIVGTAELAASVTAAGTALTSVTMEETGELIGTVRAANGEPVVGARIELDPNPIYGPYRYTQTDTGGNYRFTDVRLGNHSVSVTGNNGLTASGTTSITRDVSSVLNLQLAGTGQVRVQVNYARGAAAINAYVELVQRSSAFTDSAGRATFSAPSDVALNVRAYHPDNSSLLATGTVTIPGNGATADVVLTLPATGSIVGTVYRPGGAIPASGITVTLRRQDGIVYQQSTTTNATGNYRFNGLPLAPYTVSAEDRPNLKFADGDRSVTEDGQEVTANLTLADNRIALPADLRDANDFLFDIQQNGSIGSGWRARISSTYSVFTGGSQLEINGQAFTGDTSAALEAGRRQFVIAQPTPVSGLTVRRKIFVPRGGYFARYLEILENPGTTPVTVGVKVRSKFRNNTGLTGIVDTSSGDIALQASGSNRDTWAIADDANDRDPFITASSPATAVVLGAGAPSVTHDLFTLNTSSGTSLDVGWSSVTVPAQGRTILMHFEVQQVSRAGAKAAAQRLQQLPPEALASLTADEITAIANFEMPANGQSTVEPLPSLLGSVSGVAYEGDLRTVVPGVSVQMRSTHPLFGRTWLRPDYTSCSSGVSPASLLSSATGAFSLAGVIQDQGSIPLPVGFDVRIDAAKEPNCFVGFTNNPIGHPVSHIPSRTAVASFAAEASTATANLVFDSGVMTGTVMGPSDFGISNGTVSVTLPANPIMGSSYTAQATIQNGGAYTLSGMPAGSYGVTISVPHSQGTSLVGAPATIAVAAGQTLVTNLNIEPTGSVGGTVLTASGTAAVGSPVSLQSSGGARWVSRSTTVDSLGRYYFSAVPIGNYTLSIRDTRTNATVQSSVTVGTNQSVTQNATLLGVGMVRVTVNYIRGTPAGSIPVYLNALAVGGNNYQGSTDAQGKLTVAVPIGTYKISAYSPGDAGYSNQWVAVSGSISANNEVQDVTLTLKPQASIRVTVTDRDANNVAISGASVTLVDAACTSGCYRGVTNGSGQLLVTNVHEGSYTLTVRTSDGRIAQTVGTISAAEDGQTLDKALSISVATDKFGLLTFAGENHLYSVPANANDVISVSIGGAQVNGSASAYLTRVRFYQPNKSLLAQGYGYDSRNNYSQSNEMGNLLNIVAPVAGNFPVTVSPYYTDPQYLGGYRLEVKINGNSVAVTPYADGGSIQGTVTKADTTPAAGQILEVQSNDTLAMRVRVAADSLGAYSLAGVPVAGFGVSALEPTTKAALVTASGQISSTGETVTKDIALPKRTTVQVQISIASSLSVPSQMNFTVKDATGTRQEGPVTFAAGATVSSTKSIVVYGDQVTISAVHPNNSSATTSFVVQGADGQTVPATLTLAFTGIQGTVYSSAGQPVSSVYVRAYVASTKRFIGSTYTNSSGQYLFGSVPVGEEILVQAQEARTSVFASGRTTMQLNQANVLDIRFAGTGVITGRVTSASGQPLSSTDIRASYVYDDFNNYTTTSYASSAQDGSFTIQNMPVGRPIQVAVYLSTNFGTVSNSALATLQNPDDTATTNITLTVPTGSVLLHLVDADGVPVSDSLCYAVSLNAASGQSTSRWVCGSDTVFNNVPSGQATASANVGALSVVGPVQVNVVDGQQSQASLAASVVKGVVRFADGSPVPNPSVSLVTSNGTTLFAYNTTEQGEFRIVGVPAEAFTIKAEDSESALRTTATGTVASLDTSVTQNMTLPPSGTVSGVFRNGSGQPVANADVYIRSSAIDVDRYVRTDGTGAYSVTQVAQGNVTVLARDPATRLIASGEGVLAAGGLTVNLTVPESAAVSGTVTNDGSPVTGGTVSLSTVKTFGPFGQVTLSTTTDSAGRYTFASAPTGDVRVTMNLGGLLGSALGTAVAGTPLTLDLQVGGVVSLGYSLRGNDTSIYDVTCQGALSDGGFAGHGDAYDGAYYLSVAGSSFPCSQSAELKGGARELLIGPYVMSNLKVTRRIFVPTAGGYARYLETFVNPTTSPITVTVEVNSNLGSDSGTRLVVAPAATGGLYAVTTDGGSDPALGHVFAGMGAELTGTQTFNAPNDLVKYSWSLTVPAGGTASLMHFAIQRAPLDSTAVQQQAEALANLTQPGMFDGMTADNKANIKNFRVNP